MTKKSNAEVLEDSTEHPTGGGVPHHDKLILLDNASLLITRVLVPKKNMETNFICMYKPLEIFNDMESGEVMVREWIPESIDEFFYLPVSKIVNVSNPDPHFRKVYNDFIKPTELARHLH